jgi:hypothetical protein
VVSLHVIAAGLLAIGLILTALAAVRAAAIVSASAHAPPPDSAAVTQSRHGVMPT